MHLMMRFEDRFKELKFLTDSFGGLRIEVWKIGIIGTDLRSQQIAAKLIRLNSWWFYNPSLHIIRTLVG